MDDVDDGLDDAGEGEAVEGEAGDEREGLLDVVDGAERPFVEVAEPICGWPVRGWPVCGWPVRGVLRCAGPAVPSTAGTWWAGSLAVVGLACGVAATSTVVVAVPLPASVELTL